MKYCTSVAAALLILAAGVSKTHAVVKYWDINGTAAGATFGDGIADGTWDIGSANWNTDPTGGAAGTITGWTATTDDAVFSAGSDVGTDPTIAGAFITLNATESVAASVTVEEGYIALRTGVMDTPQTTVKAGALLEADSVLRFHATNVNKMTLQGGTYVHTNFGHAGSALRAVQSIEIDGTGTILYNDTVARTAADCQCTIYTPGTGQGIKGVGGTNTAGTGTLIKRGDGEFRVQGAQLPNFSFQKLLVEDGLYRIGATAGGTEVGFGAAPTAGVLTDAITLNGGEMGASLALTLHANRGITIGPNGGMFNNGGAGVITIPGPITGSGTMTVGGAVLSTTSANHGVSSGGTTLTNPGNTSTFNGNVVVNASTLTLNESLTTPRFSGGVTTNPAAGIVLQPVVTIGTVSVATTKMFTVGSDGTSTSYAGRVTGAGTFRKVGGGTLTMDAGQTDHDPASTVAEFNGQWTNTGGVIIDGGSIRYGNALAGFGTTTPVTVNNTATLDMNNINDTFGALQSDVGQTTGSVLQGTGEITLASSAGPFAYGGTVTGTGTFRKGRALPGGATDTAVQALNGNNSLGPVEVNAGSLLFNGTNTTGAVTINGGTLGGSGSLTGAVTANSGGHIAPGASAGILTVGSASMLDGSFLDIEIGGTSFPTDFDRLASAGAIAVNGTLNVALINGYTPANNDSVHIVTAGGGVTGTFDTVNLPVLEGVTWDLDYNSFSVSLTALVAAAGLAGDFNEDDVVDAADYVTWRKNEVANNPLPNDNGAATQAARYDVWTAHFGESSPGGGSGLAAVPEPASIVLLMLGLVPVAFGRRSR